MEDQPLPQFINISVHFAELEDPRVERTRKHSLHDILVVALCAMLSGADDFVHFELFGQAKEAWLRKFLRLEGGIPSHDTFGRVFSKLDPAGLARCFDGWLHAIAVELPPQVIAIDGKTLRRSFDRAAKKSALHLVSAFATESQVLLGQVATEAKSNEITAIPKLLDLLFIKGSTITIDAMGCQRKIVEKVVERGADYVISLKGNQSTMNDEVRAFFDRALADNFSDMPHTFCETTDGDHGRVEVRRHWLSDDIAWFEDLAKWKGLRSFGMISSSRTVDDATTTESRFYISSLPGDAVRAFAQAARSHWAIENQLHWVLDTTFREDDCRVRLENAAENLALLRRIVLQLLRQDKGTKRSLKSRRFMALWQEDYILKLLSLTA